MKTVYLTPDMRAVLAAIDKHGPVTAAGLLDLPDAEIADVVADQSTSLRNRIITLREHGMVVGTQTTRGQQTEYDTTNKGKRHLAMGHSDDTPGQIAGPRLAPPPGDYEGHELRPFTGRPGAMDAFTKPSLENGVIVEHRPPTSMGSGGSTGPGRQR